MHNRRAPLIGAMLLLLLTTGCLPRRSSQSTEMAFPPTSPSEHASTEQSNGEPAETSSSAPVLAQQEQQKQGEAPPPSSLERRKQGTQQAPQYVIDALDWALEFRRVFTFIDKLRAIEVGTYQFQEGEVPPDIHQAYSELHAGLQSVVLPTSLANIRSLIEEMDRELGAVIATLSRPPLREELERADAAREGLRSKIELLYKILHEQRTGG